MSRHIPSFIISLLDVMDLDFDLLTVRCFLMVAKYRSFRAAADSLCLSPAALGKRVTALERQLGVKLFERTTRRVWLTPRGAQAIPRARRVIEESARLAQELAEPGPVEYSLSIGTRFELGLSWLVPALEVLSSSQPHRVIHLSFGDGADMVERVQSGRVDAAIASTRRTPRGAQFMTLHEENYVFVGAETLLRSFPLQCSDDAVAHTLLDIGPTRPLFRYFLSPTKSDAPWPFRSTHYLGTIAAIRERVLRGHGVAVLPLYFVSADLDARKLVLIAPSSKLESDAFRLVWLADHPESGQLRELGKELQAIPIS